MLIEIAKGGVSNRGVIIDSPSLSKYLQKETELFRSYFSFDKKIKEHIATGRKTPQGFIGKFYLDQIVLDIDKGADTLENTILRVQKVANSLIKDWYLEDNFQIWFSGTGFHIHLPDIFGFEPSNKLPGIVRTTIENCFPEADTKPVHARGLIRVGYSYNKKSKLYKIPIKETDIWFLTPDKVNELASEFSFDNKPIRFTKPEKLFTNLIAKPIKKATTELKASVTQPNKIVTCMQHCYNAGEVTGTRHNRIMSMTSWQRRNGTPLKATIEMMKAYAPSLEPYEVEKYVTDVYEKDYNFGCESEVMKQFCDTTCIFSKNKNYLPSIISAVDMDMELHNLYSSNYEERMLDLGKVLEIPYKVTTFPGDVVVFAGISGINKTALVQNIMVHLPEKKRLYVSTEFSNLLLHRRFLQITHSMTESEIIEHFKVHNNHLGQALKGLEYAGITPNLTQLEEFISKQRPDVVALDVTNDIRIPGYTPRSTSEEEELAMRLKNIADKYSIVMLCVHHLPKSSTKEIMENGRQLRMYDVKGSGGFIQKCDIAIGISGNPTKNIRDVYSIKVRDNKPFHIKYKVDMETFQFNKEIQ